MISYNNEQFDPTLFELIPHRPPMLLINRVVDINANSSSALVIINDKASFFRAETGVPSWIGLEYMGQTAALIAGYQLKEGLVEPHLGFLLGTRSFKAYQENFLPDTQLLIKCKEKALVGNDLATFECNIYAYDSDKKQQENLLATANLSVFRKPLSPIPVSPPLSPQGNETSER